MNEEVHMALVSFVVLYCSNPEHSRYFYEQLGFTFPNKDRPHPKGPNHFAGTDCKQVTRLELFPTPPGEKAVPVPMGICVYNIDDVLARLTVMQIKVHDYTPAEGETPTSAVVFDPDFRELHLTEVPRPRT